MSNQKTNSDLTYLGGLEIDGSNSRNYHPKKLSGEELAYNFIKIVVI